MGEYTAITGDHGGSSDLIKLILHAIKPTEVPTGYIAMTEEVVEKMMNEHMEPERRIVKEYYRMWWASQSYDMKAVGPIWEDIERADLEAFEYQVI